MIQSHRDLKVWQSAMDLTEIAYRLTASFPKNETYGMTAQIRRCAVSIPANIAEGYGRDSTGSYVQFLKMARGSLREFETHIAIAVRVNITTDAAVEPVLEISELVGRMLFGLINSLQTNIGRSASA